MPGIYVAKPAAVVGSGLPPGWRVSWAFPGPWPPGYTPELSYNLNTGVTYLPGATHDMTATLRDQDDYTTGTPSDDITWKAAISGIPIELKFDGDAEWSSSLTSSHSSVGDYYGAEPTFLFNVTAAEDGEIITLTATSKPFGDQPLVTENAQIEVEVSYTWTAKLEFESSFPGGGSPAYYLDQLSIRADSGESVTQRAFAEVGYHWFIGAMWGEDVDGDLTVTQVSTYKGRIEVDEMEDSIYQVRFDSHSNPGDTTVAFTLTIYRNGEEYATYTAEKTFTTKWDPPTYVGDVWVWLTLDMQGDGVTLVDEMLDEPASLGVWP